MKKKKPYMNESTKRNWFIHKTFCSVKVTRGFLFFIEETNNYSKLALTSAVPLGCLICLFHQ